MVKKFDKIIEIPVSLGRRGRGDMFTRQILLKIQKSIGNGPKLVIFIACWEKMLDMMLRENR